MHQTCPLLRLICINSNSSVTNLTTHSNSIFNGVLNPSSFDVEKLTFDIFSILENKFLFGGYDDLPHKLNSSAAPIHSQKIVAGETNSQKVRILSIDGGDATDRILAAASLVRIEFFIRLKFGNPNATVADYFDWVKKRSPSDLESRPPPKPPRQVPPRRRARTRIRIVRMMVGSANSAGGRMVGVDGGAGYSGAIGDGGGFGRKVVKEYDEKMTIEIYKSVVIVQTRRRESGAVAAVAGGDESGVAQKGSSRRLEM